MKQQQRKEPHAKLSDTEIRRALIKELIRINLQNSSRRDDPEDFVDTWNLILKGIKDNEVIRDAFDRVASTADKPLVTPRQVYAVAIGIQTGKERLRDAALQSKLYGPNAVPKKLDVSLMKEHSLYRRTFPDDFSYGKDGIRRTISARGHHEHFTVIFDEDSVSIKPDCGHNLTAYLCQGEGWKLCLRCALERVRENEAVNRVRQQQEVSGESSLVFQGE